MVVRLKSSWLSFHGSGYALYLGVMLTFGLPIPLNPDNVFSISKKAWLLGHVSVPEGILEGFARPILEEDAAKIKAVLDDLFPETILLRSEAPLQYKFFINGTIPVLGSPEYKTAMAHMPSIRVITLKQLCKYFESCPTLWGDPELAELLELVQDGHPERWARLCKEYTFMRRILC
jgi:hypothetical protein